MENHPYTHIVILLFIVSVSFAGCGSSQNNSDGMSLHHIAIIIEEVVGEDDYQIRKSLTPVPGFAKAALNDIKNSVFHRMGDIIRRGGSEVYKNAVSGFRGGVD